MTGHPRRNARFVLAFCLGACGLVFALGGAARLSGHEVWDDGLMFSRYAENLAEFGEVTWNPPESSGTVEPTWGITSLGHLAVVVSIRAVLSPLGGDALSWAVVSSWLAGWVFLALILWAAPRHSEDSGEGSGPWLMAWTGLCLAAGFRSVGAHFGTGMDTMTALAWLTGFLVSARSLERRPGRDVGPPAALALVSLTAALTFFVRPDAALFPACVLGTLVIFGPARRRASAAVLGAAAVGGALWLLARGYFGTWLPLPFYVKSGGQHYGDAFAAEYAGVAPRELGLFAAAFALPFVAVLLDAASAPKRWWRETTAVEKGLAGSVVLFVAYHLTQVAPIMGGSQRFYQPMLPALLWLSWGSVLRLGERFRSHRPALAIGGLLMVVLLGHSLVIEGSRLRAALDRESWPTLALETAYRQRATHYWPALDVVVELSPATQIAATEVGLPGAMNPHKVVVDLAGLHDPEFALQGFSADRVFTRRDGSLRRPDILYLPHPHYETMLRDLLHHPVLEAEYRVWEASELASVLGVAVRRSSPAEEPMATALDEMAKASLK